MVSSSPNEAFQAADLKTLRATVVSGQTRPEAWRRLQLKRLSDLLDRHESDILQALRIDLAKPELEGMFEIVALLQELKITRRRLKAWMRPRHIPRADHATARAGPTHPRALGLCARDRAVELPLHAHAPAPD